MTFLHIMSVFIGLGGAISLFFFRKGGLYNPHPTDTSTDGGRIYIPGTPIEPLKMPPQPLSPPERVYQVAKSLLGQKLGDDIDPSVACAQSVSNVLIKAGYKNPKIATVNGLISWMTANGFREIIVPVPGCVVTAHSVNILSTEGAHCGIPGKTWIMSNSSYTDSSNGLIAGTWQANYTYEGWRKAFAKSKTRYFLPA